MGGVANQIVILLIEESDVLGRNRYASVTDALSELNWLDICQAIFSDAIVFIFKLENKSPCE